MKNEVGITLDLLCIESVCLCLCFCVCLSLPSDFAKAAGLLTFQPNLSKFDFSQTEFGPTNQCLLMLKNCLLWEATIKMRNCAVTT